MSASSQNPAKGPRDQNVDELKQVLNEIKSSQSEEAEKNLRDQDASNTRLNRLKHHSNKLKQQAPATNQNQNPITDSQRQALHDMHSTLRDPTKQGESFIDSLTKQAKTLMNTFMSEPSQQEIGVWKPQNYFKLDRAADGML